MQFFMMNPLVRVSRFIQYVSEIHELLPMWQAARFIVQFASCHLGSNS